ncbi:MAG: peptidase dimerization domain-containing protein, partial [Acidobacteriota bacterium]
GKVTMTEAGIFNGLDAALMVHPGTEDRVEADSLACQTLQVVYRGRAAHAVAHPEKGINALDPLLALFAGRDALLRRSPSHVKVVGVINEGGLRPNIVPARASGRFSLRAPTRQALATLVEQFSVMSRAVGEAHQCQVEILKTDGAYHEMVSNRPLATAYGANLQSLGVSFVTGPRNNKGSLDMGNVSYQVPSLHPFFALVPPYLSSHTREFARATLTAAGRSGLLRSVQALAMTGLDVLQDGDLRSAMHEEHRRLLGSRP